MIKSKASEAKNNRPISASQKKKVTPNYSSINIHESLDRAKSYSNLVKNHFKTAQYENHVLLSACRAYDSQIKRKVKNINKKSTSSTLQIKNPEQSYDQDTYSILSQKKERKKMKASSFYGAKHFENLKSILGEKTEKVPEYGDMYNVKVVEKKKLEEKIERIKKQIMKEKKEKAKIFLQCNKLMNQRQIIQDKTLKKQEETFKLTVENTEIQKECIFLLKEIDIINQKVIEKSELVSKEKDKIPQLKQDIKKARLKIMEGEKQINEVKERQTLSYKSMSNNYMVMNQFKEEKALLLNSIQNSYKRNF